MSRLVRYGEGFTLPEGYAASPEGEVAEIWHDHGDGRLAYAGSVSPTNVDYVGRVEGSADRWGERFSTAGAAAAHVVKGHDRTHR